MQRRTHAIEAARNSSRDLFDMEDLSLAGSASDSDTDVPPQTVQQLAVEPPPKISKQKRKSHKPTFKSWAKNLLSHAETLDLREGTLPDGLERDWRMSVVPKGKRCLCATTNDSGEFRFLFSTSARTTMILTLHSDHYIAAKNTILYSRVAGYA